MRGQGRRVSHPALLVAGVLLASVAACDATAPNPSVSVKPAASGAAAGPPVLADVLAFRGSFERTGQMPGPGPQGKPIRLWEYDSAGGYETQPLIVDGLVIAISLDGELAALDGATGVRRHVVQLPAGATGTPAVAGDTLFVVTHDGVLRTVSLTDWGEGWSQPGYNTSAAPAIAGDLVLAGGIDGALVARRTRDGSESWREPAEDSMRVSVAKGEVAMSGSSSDRVKIVELDDRALVLDEATGGAEAGTTARKDGNAYLVHRDVVGGSNGVDAFDANGNRIWSWDEPESLRLEGMTVDGENVYAVTETPGRIHALDRATGAVRWPAVDVGGTLIGGDGVAGGLLYVIGTTNGLSAIDTSTGSVVWSVPLEATDAPARLVVSGGLVIASTKVASGGRIVAFAAPTDPRAKEATTPSAAAGTPSPSAQPVATELPGVRRIREHSVDVEADMIGATAGPDGTLYVPDIANHRILVQDPAGNQRWWGEHGSGKGQFDFTEATQHDAPASVAVSPDGELIAVGEAGNHRVQLFDRNLKWVKFIGRTGRGDGQFITPYPTISVDHRIWVVDSGRADVQVFDEAGAFLTKFPNDGDIDHELSRPSAVYVREDVDEVLLPDFGNHRVAVFRKDGTWLRSYETNAKERFFPAEVNMAMPDPAGRLLILDTASRIYYLDADGHVLETLTLGDTFRDVDLSGVAITPTGRLFLVDRFGDRIVEAQLEPPFWPAD